MVGLVFGGQVRTAETQTAGSPPHNSVAVSTTTNRITTSGYNYDLSGNMTNDGYNSLMYDGENRATSASNGSASATYTYDANGLRVKKAVQNGTTTVYLFSGSRVVAEYENGAAASSPTREYIYSGAALVAKIEGSSTVYYHPDRLSVRVTTNSSGTVAGQQGHYPFGETWYAQNTTAKWEYTTYERDAESGNDYAMARYDVNRLGRFLSPDPVGGSGSDPQSMNRYAYVENDPIDLADPTGLCPPWGPYISNYELKHKPDGGPYYARCRETAWGEGGSIGTWYVDTSDTWLGEDYPDPPYIDFIPPTIPFRIDIPDPVGGGKPPAPEKTLGDVLTCASKTANTLSIAGLINVDENAHPALAALTNGALGNTFSGIVDLGSHIHSAVTATNFHQSAVGTLQVYGDLAVSGLGQGVYIGEKFASNPAVVGAVGQATNAVLGTTAAATFGLGKLALDGLIFFGSVAYCAAK